MSGRPNVASSAAIRMSHSIASSKPPGQHVAAQRRDGRDRQALHREAERLELLDVGAERRRVHGQHRGEVAAGRERTTGRRDQERPDRAIATGPLDRRQQRTDQLGRERVELGRPVEPQDLDATGSLDQQWRLRGRHDSPSQVRTTRRVFCSPRGSVPGATSSTANETIRISRIRSPSRSARSAQSVGRDGLANLDAEARRGDERRRLVEDDPELPRHARAGTHRSGRRRPPGRC